ncbi:MAG: hypothetical protein WDN66_01805 [Candidatus Saccharibacteria bacterium]
MSVSAIQDFLISENSGLKTLTDVENCNPSTPTLPDPYANSYYASCGSTVSAAQIIYDAGQAYGINPQALMATMQKEQSLITAPNPTSSQINCAMGYDSCHADTGFFNQVDNGAWAFRRDIQLENGQSYWGYSPSSYPCGSASSLYSTGLYPGRTVTFADPGGTAETETLANASTAALYCYTPYVGPYSTTGYSGSYNFVVYYEDWWGTDASPCYNDSNVASEPTSASIIPFNFQGSGNSLDDYSLLLQNNTSSDCVEIHGLTVPAGASWYNHIATGMKSTNSSQGQILPYQYAPGSPDTLLYVNYGSGTSNVNVHEFSPDLTEMPGYYDTNTNLGSVTSSQGTFVTGDFLGQGKDQLAYVLYDGSSGHVEIHIFNPGLNQGVGYYDVVTNLLPVTAGQGMFVSGDFLGNGRDQLAYILYNGSSGHAEVHLFNPSLTQGVGYYDAVTDLPNFSPSNGTFIAGNFLGKSGVDQLALVLYNGTGSGNVEVHLFNPSLTQGIGYYDTVTTIGAFNPSQ